MKKVIFYLKPHTFGILFCLIFLTVQGFCELSLPNYMSNIVNVGIQQNGIESSAPEAMSENFYSFLEIFMTDSEKNVFSKNYKLLQSDIKDNNYEDYVKKYPLLEKESIYILNNSDIDEISRTFDSVCFSMINFFKLYFPNYNISSNTSNHIDLLQIYSLKPQLQSIPQSTFDEIKKNISLSNKDLAKQTSLYITKELYSELGMDTDNIQKNYILKIGLIMLIFTLISSIASVLVSFITSKIATKTAKNLRHEVFKKVESLSNNEFNKFSTASLITRTTNDITQIQTTIINSVRILFYAPILALGGIIMALSKSVSMYWTILLGILILVVLIVSVFIIIFPKFNLVQKLVDKFNLVTKENLSGIMVIMMPSMMLLMNLISVLIIWTGSHKIENSQIQVGDMIAFMQYAIQIIMAFLMISFMLILVPRAAVSAKRIAEVLDTEPSIKNKSSIIKVKKSQIKGKIEFKNVSFCYNDAQENVLDNINFTAWPGQTTAFIGPTGSGKSTLVNLIPRFFDVTDGEILIDGINIKDISQENLHDIIGYVPQKGILFSGNIESNLKFGNKNASEKDLKLVADISQSTEFIASNKDGFKRKISQNGSNVSGGQRQRLSIARTILKNAPIYIFDDSFSALDLKTDAALRRSLYPHTKNSTILVVAQRISTIINAEQIVVLDDGKIVGIGTHSELLKNCETYKEIASSQLPKEKIV